MGDRIVHLTKTVQKGTAAASVMDTAHFHYDGQGKPAMVVWNGTRFGYLYNAQGDVLGLVTGGHSEVVKYTYDAWGKVLKISGARKGDLALINPFRYRGYIYDAEMEMYYLQTRYYKPEWGRFISADAIYENNLYAYCENNPIRLIDPHGAAAKDANAHNFGGYGEIMLLTPALEKRYFKKGLPQEAKLTDLCTGNTFNIKRNVTSQEYHTDFWFAKSEDKQIGKSCLSSDTWKTNWEKSESWSQDARPGLLSFIYEGKENIVAVGYVMFPHVGSYEYFNQDGEMCMFFGSTTEGYAIVHGNRAAVNAFLGKYEIVPKQHPPGYRAN